MASQKNKNLQKILSIFFKFEDKIGTSKYKGSVNLKGKGSYKLGKITQRLS